MRILFDTNIILDLLLDREPFSTIAAHLFSKVETGELSGYICATTITTVHYIAHKIIGADPAKGEISRLLALFEIAPVNRPVLEAALASQFTDFEDAVVYQAALHVDAQGIATRDPKGFVKAALPIYAPEELLKMVQALP